MELWCKLGSWGVCKDCRSLQLRPLEPIDTRRVAKAEITARTCKQCRGRQWVPQPSEIPEPLRKLNKKLIEVLRPLEIDVGPYKQAGNGYRIHSAMSRFSWCKDSVRTKIGQVRNRSKRAKVLAAYDYLMTDEAESSYKDFVKKHNKFLRKYPDATDSDRRRPLQFIETVGLECAMWPSLYWCTEMCETTERATDSRRVAAAAVSAGNAALSDDENEEQAEEGSGRHSVKRSFMRKVFSPIIGYGHDFELLQFVYDLTMWSRIGGGKSACAGLPLRLVLKGETFSPLYWKSKHQALLDMQRQCGYPSLFKTMAPWEYSFPYHFFVLDEMEKGGRGRMQLAGLETLHTAHVFTELNRGLYSGRNKTSAQDGWKDHILSADSVPEERRPQTVVNYFQRLEFQWEAQAAHPGLSWERPQSRLHRERGPGWAGAQVGRHSSRRRGAAHAAGLHVTQAARSQKIFGTVGAHPEREKC